MDDIHSRTASNNSPPPLLLTGPSENFRDRCGQQAYELEMLEAQKAEDEYSRQQQIQDRLYKQDEELRMKEQEEKERR